ncbi:MFS transporter [Chachezhania antarctica]|uniref:MFS transporter n=1 Tax=Chachezhania antarctica TaxID=2340860 RepID=UPI000EB119BE|nr:MFS transporter [Chachezhania antarctica]
MDRTTTAFAKVIGLWAAGMGAAAQFGKVSVAYTYLAEIYGNTGAALGFAVSLVGSVGIVFGVVAGLVVARTGFRRALIWALLLGAVLSGVQALLPPLWLFLVSRAAEGASHLAIVVAAPTLIAQISAERHRGLTLSLWSTFFGVAFSLLVWLGLPLLRTHGVPALFAAHGVYMAAMAGLILILLPRDVVGPQPGTLSPRAILAEHVEIYRSPYLSAAGLGWVFYAGSYVAILTIMPPFVPEAIRAATFAAFPLVGIASSMTLGVWLLRRVPAVRVVRAGFVAALLASVAIVALPGAGWPYLLLSAVLGLVQGASFTAIPQLNAGARGQAQANGAMAQMGNVGTTFGTPVLAALVLGLGLTGFLIFAATLFAGGALVHTVTAARRARVVKA